jgi:hypothetical protein
MSAETAEALATAAAQMQQAARMLERGADGQEIAQVQQQIQDALRAATQSALGSMQAMRNQSQNQNQPGGSGGTGGSGSAEPATEELPEAVMKLGDNWGDLPGNVKNQILQAMDEGYPKEFEEMIQVYFRGLAETNKDEK